MPESPAWAMQSVANLFEAAASHASHGVNLRAISGSSSQSNDVKRFFSTAGSPHSSKLDYLEPPEN